MQNYHDLLLDTLQNGEERNDRTGTGTIAKFGGELIYDLQKGFPAITTKRLAFRAMALELLWFISGCEGGVKALHDQGCTIWDEWEGKGEIPYAAMQWQLRYIIKEIKANPTSRRLLGCNWDRTELFMQNSGLKSSYALPACHALFQFYVSNDSRLHCKMYQRSADLFLGVPFNIASYALLTHIVANECGLRVGELHITFGDRHIYKNHIEQVKEQLSREHRQLPTLRISEDAKGKRIFDISIADFALVDYNPHPAIKAEVSV